MAVDEGAWDGGAAMSGCANSDDPAAAYRAICAGRREGDPSLQSSWALPHHMHPGDGPNAAGVRNALSRLPQTEGLTNRDAAQSHLDAHMAEIRGSEERSDAGLHETTLEADVVVRDMAKREISARIVPWDVVIDTAGGPEMFKRGAFAVVDPRAVVLRMDHQNPAAGRGIDLEERDDGAHMTFKVSATARGDEILTLASDGVTRGVSIGFLPVPGGTAVETRNGRRVSVHKQADLREVSTTWIPAYRDAEILSVRSDEGDAPVAEQDMTTPVEPDISVQVDRQLAGLTTRMGEQFDKLADRLEKMEERSRSQFSIPATVEPKTETPSKGVWMQSVLRMLSGERIPEMQTRALADLITTDNIGVVPPAYLSEIIGIINRRRPFLESTRRLGTPSAGMSLVLPRIVTRPTVGIQAAEKDELTSTKTEIDTVTFDAVTKGGAGDISLQLLKRSDPSFLALYLELLFEAYALDSEQEAIAALLGLGSGGGFGSGGFGNGGVNDGGTLDPENANFGDAWINGYNTMYGGPDTIWLSSEAVGAFIDAKATTTNQPLYWTLQANVTAAGGVGGNISGLRPVHTPGLNGTGVDILVGPSNGFAWAEDGTYTLQVDVPAKAGRDVAVVGILWFAPLYPTAFTGWALGGS